jgi:HPt (histidine-containing phosphotransfer) domain-containing protein
VHEPDVLDSDALAMLDELTGGDPAFLDELIDTWVGDGAEQLEAMRQSLAAGDTPTLRRAAHSLKSTSQSLGAVLLASVCAEIEAAARNGAIDAASPLLPVAQRRYEESRAALLALRRAA